MDKLGTICGKRLLRFFIGMDWDPYLRSLASRSSARNSSFPLTQQISYLWFLTIRIFSHMTSALSLGHVEVHVGVVA
ncbi:MAG: hypothetical protein CM15mP49_25980 [Actinomycetota bacterium]|nr:MAG: hypothetical protein CM15mP49_25980 [Actinomycetota bacterium]